jgi:hypothetical protein
MSFDVFVQDLPSNARTVADIPHDFAPQPLGSRAEILAGILRAAPEADFCDPAWGKIEGAQYSIEVNIGPEDPVTSFAFHVRGGEGALLVIANILAQLQFRAIAPGTKSGFFDLSELGVAYAKWQAYRQQVIGD